MSKPKSIDEIQKLFFKLWELEKKQRKLTDKAIKINKQIFELRTEISTK